MDNENAVSTYNGILCSLKKEDILSHATIWMNPKDIMLNRPVAKEQIPYSIHMDYPSYSKS